MEKERAKGIREDNPMKISVIVVAWNRKILLQKNLLHASQFRNTFDEMIVVDNGSTDRTAEMVKDQFPWARLIRLPRNYGVLEARNIGALNSNGDLLLFLDDDGCFDFSALRSMAHHFEKDKSLGVLSGRVVDLPRKDVFNLRFAEYRLKEPRVYYSDRYKAGVSLIRKQTFLEAGMLPGHFFYGTEERDFALRAFKKGYKVMVFNGAILLHKKGIQRHQNKRFYSFHYRNRLFQIWRNLPSGPALLETLLTLSAGFFASLYTGNFFPFLRGTVGGFLRLPRIILSEREPLTLEEYRTFKERCGDQLEFSKRFSGLLRNISMQKGKRLMRFMLFAVLFLRVGLHEPF